jgi:hypothetical protein
MAPPDWIDADHFDVVEDEVAVSCAGPSDVRGLRSE